MAAVFVTCLVVVNLFSGCEKPEKEKPKTPGVEPIEYEPFVIEGMPTTKDLYQVAVLPNGTQINSVNDYAENIVNIEAACYVKQAEKTATYSGTLLLYPASSTLWTGSGTHVIVVTTESAFKVGDCTFTNGSGKLQYGSLKTIPFL